MLKRRCLFAVWMVSFLTIASSGIASAQNGGVPVRITDGPGNRCIDTKKDMVWLTLRRVVTEKNGSWFTENKSIATIFKAQVTGTSTPVTFPLAAESKLDSYAKGQVSVPIEYSIVNGFKLKQTNVEYRGIQLDMTFLNLDKRNGWGTALQVLSGLAKKLPLPNTPLAQAGSYILDFANKAVDQDVDKVAGSDKATSASLVLNFDPTGACSAKAAGGGDFEKTGTIAILYSSGDAAGFLVPLGSINDYCWDADLQPMFLLKAAKKDGIACSDKAHYRPAFKQITNNYAGYFLNAVESTDQLSDTQKTPSDRQAAQQRCVANGYTVDDCLKRVK